jgi:PAS domain-containing protein
MDNKRSCEIDIKSEGIFIGKKAIKLPVEDKLSADILNAFKDVVAYYTPTHNILWLNDAGKKQLGIEDESYVGKLCHKVWFNEDKPCQNCPVVSHILETTERLVTFDDNRIWMIRHTPLFNPDGTLNGFIEFRADTTRISNLEKQILDEREKYKMLAENAPFGLLLTQDNKPVYVNQTFLTWFRLDSVSDFENTDLIRVFHPNDRKIAHKLFRKIENNNVPAPMVEKLRIIDKDGNLCYIRFDLKNNIINSQKYIQTVIINITADVLKEKKQKQVAADALYLNQKNSILTEIESVLTKTLNDRKFSKSQKEFKKIFDIINSFKQLDKDWKMLIANFEEVHPGFFSRLKNTHPLLSSNDIKHCACIKMNFGTKEIARFFNIKDSSVQISRVRLKKKMNLDDSNDLRTYILNF